MVDRGFGFAANLEIDKVYYADDPRKAAENLAASFGVAVDGPVDGLAGGDQAVIFPDDKRLRFASFGDASLSVSSPFSGFLERLKEGLSLPVRGEAYSDMRLRTGLELYSAYYYEHSSNAKLLTLVMALEALAIPTSKAQIALDLISGWNGEVETRISKLDPASDEYEALESLQRELLFRRESSLRSRIRNLVAQTLRADGLADTKEMERKAVSAYDKRSLLVHNGRLDDKDLQTAQTDAKVVLEAVLKAKLRSDK
jgi:hypothetical protein